MEYIESESRAVSMSAGQKLASGPGRVPEGVTEEGALGHLPGRVVPQ